MTESLPSPATPEEVLLRVGDLCERAHGRQRTNRYVNLAPLLNNVRTQSQVQVLIEVCVGNGWLERNRAQGRTAEYAITPDGMVKLHALANEPHYGPVERWLRKESLLRGTTWNTVLHGVTFAVAVLALIFSTCS